MGDDAMPSDSSTTGRFIRTTLPEAKHRGTPYRPLLFAAFCSSACLFLLELFAGKLLLPRFGGAPAVWISCLSFFQVTLVAAYATAHAISRRAPPRLQVAVVATLFITAGMMSLVMDRIPPVMASAGVLPELVKVPAVLACTVGPAFFTLATLAPLLGHWHAMLVGDRGGKGKEHAAYGLYAAGNLGSFSALLAYPFLLEPMVGLKRQATFLWVMFAVVGLLTFVSGRRAFATAHVTQSGNAEPTTNPVSWRHWLRWVLLAAVPASLLASVTTHLTVEIAPLPLLWIVPLAIYLGSYVLVFSRARPWFQRYESVAMIVTLPFVIWLVNCDVREPMKLVLLAHCALFSVICIALHGMLADDRPPVAQLTTFYIAMACGGALGGLLNATFAPLVFDAHYEFPIALAAAAGLLRVSCRERSPATRLIAASVATAFWALATGCIPGLPIHWSLSMVGSIAAAAIGLRFFQGWERTLAITILLLGGFWVSESSRQVIYRTRTFFGVLRVAERANGPSRELIHGSIRHGAQLISSDPERRRIPLTYYHPAGPLGSIFGGLRQCLDLRRVAVAGLGVGTVASYAEPGQEFVFVEIDPAIVRISRNDEWFTFLADCQGRARIVVDDARLAFSQESDGSFDLLLVDAFTGDSVPTHLLTREALALYGRKVSPHGVIAMHISNRYLDLAPVVEALAADGGWMALDGDDRQVPTDVARLGSRWMVLSRSPETLRAVYANKTSDRWGWRPAVGRAVGTVWTDDRAPVADALISSASE